MDKKISVFCMLAVLALTGCQISDLNADQSSLMAESDKVIGFNIYTSRTVTKSTDLNQSFNVESFLSGASSRTQFFTSTTYKYSDSKYIGDVNHYWPSNTSQNLDFYAVSPLKYKNTDSTEVDLTPAADSTIVVTGTDGTTDIVASRTLNAPNGTTPAAVNLTFGHKLTKVSFTAVGKDTTKKYVITDLKLNANSTSTYQFGASENWGDSSDEYRYDYIKDSVTVSNTSKPKSLGTKYLIPKQADNLTASIWYKVYEGSTLIDDHSADSVNVTLPVKNVWGVNKNVVYALTIDIKGNLIEFSPVVLEDWDTETVIPIPPYFAVDLGLSVKWASCNVGAYSPEDYGDYYAWGETEIKSDYTESTYKWSDADYDTMKKYCTSSSYGTVDNKTVLEQGDDVAHVKWGGSWRMPTNAEWKELVDNCTWTWTTVGGVNGRLVTSNKVGYTDNSIFLPAAGFLYGTSRNRVGSDGIYWSSSLNTGFSLCAWYMNLNSDKLLRNYYFRYYGQSVRPVTE